MIYLFI